MNKTKKWKKMRGYPLRPLKNIAIFEKILISRFLKLKPVFLQNLLLPIKLGCLKKTRVQKVKI